MDVIRPRRRRKRWVFVALAAVVAVGAGTFGLRAFARRPRAIDGAALWTDTVTRGPLLLEVQGTGTLLPEEIRFLSAPVAARVDKIHVRPGAEVQPDTILVELSNPDVELAALEAERELAGAESRLTSLGAQLEGQRLQQQSAISTLDMERADAERQAKANETLAEKGVLSNLEREQATERAKELTGRLELEKRRLGALGKGNSAQLQAQKAEIDRLRAIAEFRRRQVEALKLRAGVPGVVQELSLQQGESVAAGATVAKVVRPDRLKAELRIPEIQAKDVTLGQPAVVDLRSTKLTGKVARIDPAAAGGSVRVDISFGDQQMPPGARPDLNVDGVIELAKVKEALYIKRPAFGDPGSNTTIFRIRDGVAVRVPVQFGRASVKAIEILGGLAEGDQVILSDMSQWQGEERLEIR